MLLRKSNLEITLAKKRTFQHGKIISKGIYPCKNVFQKMAIKRTFEFFRVYKKRIMYFYRLILVYLSVLAVSPQTISVVGNSSNTCNIIRVTGNATVKGTPDVAVASLLVSASSNTSTDTLTQMNNRTKQLLNVFIQFNVSLATVQTTSLNFNPVYNTSNGKQTLVGEKAGQTFSLKITNISNTSAIGALADAITAIGNISVKSLTFDISDKSSLITQASTNAWNDAYSKAQQYSQLAGVTLGDVLAIRVLLPANPNQVPEDQGGNSSGQDNSSMRMVNNFQVQSNLEVDFKVTK